MRFQVCNPATWQWADLPSPTPRLCYNVLASRFYFHRPFCEHRLLCIGYPLPPSYEYHAPSRAYLSLGKPAAGSDDAVEHACKFYYILYTCSSGEAEPRRLGPVAEGDNYPFPSACVAIRGTLYWSHHPEDGGSGDVVVFDTVSEAFRLIPSPPPLAEHNLRTFEMDGRLDVSAAEASSQCMDVWALEDGGEKGLPPPRRHA